MAKREAMSKQTLVINPVTRIEGHGKITIQLDEQGKVADARFHVTQFRGFEKLCEGRPFYEMPSLMARICGICPVSHLVASAKACDSILATGISSESLKRIPRSPGTESVYVKSGNRSSSGWQGSEFTPPGWWRAV